MSECVPGRHGLHPALLGRTSPAMFDPRVEVSANQVDSLLDAARLAPSAGNSQPWAFIVGRRGDHVHARITPHLARSSSTWAGAASLLMVNLSHVLIEDVPEWDYSEFSRYDLGQAVAYMTIQGLVMGLDAHQFRAFDRNAIAAEFAVPDHWEVTSMTAFGTAADDQSAILESSRERRTRDDVVWARTVTPDRCAG